MICGSTYMRHLTWTSRTAGRTAVFRLCVLFAPLVVATSFGVAASTPLSAPVSGAALPGNALAVLNFAPPSANGGAPILGYAATCQAGAVSGPAIGGHGIGLDFLGTTSASVQTAPFTSVGGNIILASVGRGGFADFTTATVTDNKGNGNYSQIGTPHIYTLYSSSGTALYAKTSAAGGAGHVVSTTKPNTSDEVTVIAAEFRNVDTIVDSQWVEDRTSPNTSASVTTTGPAILAAFWWGDDNAGNLSLMVSQGWTLLDRTSSLASNHVQSGSAYKVVSGAGTYTIDWTPSTAQGAQLWTVAMQQLAGSGPLISASGFSSPIIVKGLTNGVSYTCSVTASNSAGTGAASASVSVTPSASTPFALASVQSRKVHGSAGTYDLGITTQPVSGQISVEPRAIGSGHTIVFQFNGPVGPAASVVVSPVGSATAAGSGNEVFVDLTNVPDNQRVTLTLGNVNGSFNPSPLSLGFLVGDVNGSRSVNASDISAMKARSGKTTDGSNFKFDLDVSGSLNVLDVSKVKTTSGLTLL